MKNKLVPTPNFVSLTISVLHEHLIAKVLCFPQMPYFSLSLNSYLFKKIQVTSFKD